MRGGDQLLGIGALAVAEPRVERIRRVLQRRALRGEAAFAVLTAALPLGAGVSLDACHGMPPACADPDCRQSQADVTGSRVSAAAWQPPPRRPHATAPRQTSRRGVS